MEKNSKIKTFIFGGLTLLSTSFVLLNALMSEETSRILSNSLASFFKTIINHNVDKDVEVISPTDFDLVLDPKYTYNFVENYDDNEIPYGATKKLIANVYPSNATNTMVTYSCDNDDVNLNRTGNGLFIEALNDYTSFTITAEIKNSSLKKTYTFNTVEIKEPLDYEVSIENNEIKVGESSQINIEPISKIKDMSDPLINVRYYNFTKLKYESLDSEIATVDNNGIIIAKKTGKVTIKISSEEKTKTISLNVVANVNPIVKANDNWNIECSSKTAYIGDLNYDRYENEKGKHNTSLLIKWNEDEPTNSRMIYTTSNPMIAMVDKNGIVRGYRKEGVATIYATLSGTSITKSIDIEVKRVITSSLEDTKTSIEVEKGETITLSPSFLPINVTDKVLQISEVDKNIFDVSLEGSQIKLYAKASGQTSFYVYPKDNENIRLKYDVLIKPLGTINNANSNDFYSFVRKSIGHFGVFVLHGIFSTLFLYYLLKDVFKKNIFILVLSLLTGIFWAGFCEIAQIGIPGRVSSFIDVLIDTGGYLIPVVIIGLILLFLKLKEKKKGSNAS